MKKWIKEDKIKKLKKLKIPLKRYPLKDDAKYDSDEVDFLFNKNIDWADLKTKQAK